jgi:MFS-type transporter involved in bile tolerance (Atg22 family)
LNLLNDVVFVEAAQALAARVLAEAPADPAARVDSANTAVALVIGGSLVGLSTSNMLVILQYCAPPDQVGLWTGVYNFVGNMAGIVQPLITGLVIKLSGGSYALAFVLAAVMLAVSTLSYWFVVGPMRERREPLAS